MEKRLSLPESLKGKVDIPEGNPTKIAEQIRRINELLTKTGITGSEFNPTTPISLDAVIAVLERRVREMEKKNKDKKEGE